MRENFDYVSINTYHADMAESTVTAVGIIEAMRARISELERMFALAVAAAPGSEVRISRRGQADPVAPILSMERNLPDDSLIVRAHR